MTREEAISRIRQMSLPKETMDILVAIAPELAESEDERFRRYILNCCEVTIEEDDRGLELSKSTTKKLKRKSLHWLHCFQEKK